MELIVVSAIIVAGFSYLNYLHSKHLQKLETLLKADSLLDVKQYEKDEDTHTTLEESIPETIQEVFDGKSPDEINASFR